MITVPSRWLRRLGSTCAAVVASLGLVVSTSGAAEAAVAGVWQYWDYPASTSGYYNTDEFLTINKTAPTRFFAHQIWFKGGDAAYIGLQDTPSGKIAIFSVWNSPGNAVTGSAGSYCLAFSGEGVGWSCRIPYNWSVGTKYRLRIWSTAGSVPGSIQWIGAVQNTSTGVEKVIGYLWNAAGQGQISSSVSWIEDYGNTTGSCTTETAAKAVFSKPTLNAATANASVGLSQTSTCGTHASSISVSAAGNATLTE